MIKRFTLSEMTTALYISFMYFGTNLMLTIPSFVVDAFDTPDALYRGSCIGNPSLCTNDATAKFSFRAIQAFLNILMFIGFTASLEQEDKRYFLVHQTEKKIIKLEPNHNIY